MAAIPMIGTLTYVSETITNPYTGHQVVIDGEYYVTNSFVTGTNDIDFAFATVEAEYWRVEDELGNVLVDNNIEQFFPGPGTDIVNFASITHVLGDLFIQGSDDDDIIWSNSGDDNLGGQTGDDFLHGGPGHDLIAGHQGHDILIGASGNDELYGGDGDDTIYGGSGMVTILDKDFIDSIAFPNLTERVNISDLEPPGDPSLGVNDGNLVFDFDSTAEITFRKGFAGYNNTLGVYRVAEDGTIEMASLLWENVKDAGVDQTHIVDLPFGADGGEIGFFIISNGDCKNNYTGMDTGVSGNIRFVYDYNGVNERDATINDNGQDITVLYDDGLAQTVLNGDTYHTTARGGSVDLNSDGANHVVSGLAEVGNDDILRIGFEDLKNLGDADYEDVLFDVNIVPVSSEFGEGGDDILSGGAGNDLLFGGSGDDILAFGEGFDEVTGGNGSDQFVIDHLDAMVDIIHDFDASEGDVINIADLLSNYDELTDAITDFVQFTQNGANTDVQISVDGAAGSFATAFTVEFGLAGSVEDLINAGSLDVSTTGLI